MKHLFLSMAAVAMLASCSSDEIIDKAPAQKSAIGFSTFVDKSTRANGDKDKSNLGTIGVYGWRDDTKFIDGLTINVDKDGKGTYEKNDGRYWEKPYPYKFEAIHPVADGTNVSFTSAATGGTLTFTNNHTTDLLYADIVSVSTYEDTDLTKMGEVGFTFSHLLSRVQFTFTNGFVGDGMKLEISNLVVSNVKYKGTIKPNGGGTWTTSDDKTTVPFGIVSELTGGNTGESEQRYFIPESGVEYEVTFTATLTQEEATYKSSNFKGTISSQHVRGLSYNYTATIDASNYATGGEGGGTGEGTMVPITFNVESVAGWNSDWNNNNTADDDIPVTIPKS